MVIFFLNLNIFKNNFKNYGRVYKVGGIDVQFYLIGCLKIFFKTNSDKITPPLPPPPHTKKSIHITDVNWNNSDVIYDISSPVLRVYP